MRLVCVLIPIPGEVDFDCLSREHSYPPRAACVRALCGFRCRVQVMSVAEVVSFSLIFCDSSARFYILVPFSLPAVFFWNHLFLRFVASGFLDDWVFFSRGLNTFPRR